MITDWETNFKDVQANDFGNLGKNNSRNILVGNHAVILPKLIRPEFLSVGNVCLDNGKDHKAPRNCSLSAHFRLKCTNGRTTLDSVSRSYFKHNFR